MVNTILICFKKSNILKKFDKKLTDDNIEFDKQASLLNLIIKPSKNKNKKIDVYTHDGKFLHSIGDILYNDYARYIVMYNLAYANKRRELYLNRHQKNIDNVNSKQFLSARILW